MEILQIICLRQRAVRLGGDKGTTARKVGIRWSFAIVKVSSNVVPAPRALHVANAV